MVDVKEIYFEKELLSLSYWWNPLSDYTPMINAFGHVVIRVDDDGYSGDTRVLYDNDGKIGHLVFGWGSCSGCDALQACDSIEELQELCSELENSIRWFDSKEEALEWIMTHDWEGDWCWHDEETHKYLEMVNIYLKGEN